MPITKTILEDQLYLILQKYKQNKDYDLFKNGVQAFREYLHEHPHDNEVWMSYALFLNLSEVDYPDKSVEILGRLILQNRHDAKALLLFADIQSMLIGRITDNTMQLLLDFQTDDTEVASMIEYARAEFGYDYTDKKKYEESLIKSIQLCQRHSHNYTKLGEIYIARGDIKQGCELIKKAINNVKYIAPSTSPSKNICYDGAIGIPTADEYIGEFITGTLKAQTTFEDLCKTYTRYCPVKFTNATQYYES